VAIAIRWCASALLLADEPTGNRRFALSLEILRIFQQLPRDYGRLVTHEVALSAARDLHARRTDRGRRTAETPDAQISADQRPSVDAEPARAPLPSRRIRIS
jgi:ABC-type ATPase involved in cell division